MDDLSHGVEATVIDLGLSRMDAGDGTGGNEIHWTPFDEEVFMGEGNYCTHLTQRDIPDAYIHPQATINLISTES